MRSPVSQQRAMIVQRRRYALRETGFEIETHEEVLNAEQKRRAICEQYVAVVSRLVDREARASDTAITVAGDTTPGTRVHGGEAARRGRSTVSIVRIVLARRLSVAGHGLVAPRRKSPEGCMGNAMGEGPCGIAQAISTQEHRINAEYLESQAAERSRTSAANDS
jgi:hypothetical protein